MGILTRRAHLLGLAGLIAGVSLLGQLALGQAAGQAAGPSPNQKVQVPGDPAVQNLPGVQAFGNTPADTEETVAFVLREQNLAQLEGEVEQGLRSYLSVPQFAQQYGQSPAYIAQLEQYLGGYGIASNLYPDHVDLVASGTAGEFDAALSVQQRQFFVPAQPGRHGMMGVPAQTIHAPESGPELPYRLASGVAAILGLSNYGSFSSQAVHSVQPGVDQQPQQSSACLALTGLPDACNLPSNFAQNYGLSPLYARSAAGQGQTIGIVTLASLDPGAPEYFWTQVADTPTSNRTVTIDQVDGGAGPASYASGSLETDIDVEESGALAPDANIVVYEAPNTDYGFVDGFFTAASQNVAGSVSASWGSSETAVQASIDAGEESPGYLAAFNEAFLEMAAQGQSSFASAGDTGAYTAVADLGTTNLSVDTPAGSPFVTAAGGSTLPWSATFTSPDGSASVDVAQQRTWGWDYLWPAIATVTGTPESVVAESYPEGGGGGFSQLNPTPSYQQGIAGTHLYSAVEYLTPTDYQEVAPGLDEPTNWSFNPDPSVTRGVAMGRAVPDLVTDADPETGYLVYVPSATSLTGSPLQGGWGGTSFVAPQLNGSTAVIASLLGHRVGFWNPQIYAMATRPNSPFTPLSQSGTSNDNLYYTGTPRQIYNAGSGLGYPDLAQLAFDLR